MTTNSQWGPDAEEMATLQRFATWTGNLTGRPTPKLNAALAAAQAEFPVFAVEDQREVIVEHKDGGSHAYKYITLGKVIETCTPILAKHGLSFRAMPGYGDPGDGKIAMVLRYVLAHESGEEITGIFPLKADGNIQSMGSAITYARRYCFAAILNIAVETDDDGMAAQLAQDGPDDGVRAQTSGRARKGRQGSGPAARRANQSAADNLPGGDAVPTAMRNHMFGLLGKVIPRTGDDGADRDNRLGWVSGVVGRVVGSSNDLTKAEMQQVIDAAQHEIDIREEPPREEGE